MKLVYIGNHFYRDSNTKMSCIYTENGERSDWGKVQIALDKGHTVEIRPATKDELDFYNKKLSTYHEKLNSIMSDLAAANIFPMRD
jgi:hypothetical protein